MLRTRLRDRASSGGGAVVPWYSSPTVRLDGNNPSLIMQFDQDRYASSGAVRTLSDLTTFTRASTAKYVNSSKLLASAAIDTLRKTYDPVSGSLLGVLLEQQSTNLCLWSNTFNDTNYTVTGSINFTSAATTSPDGTTNATKIDDTTNNTQHFFGQTISFTNTTVYTFSVWAKAAEDSAFCLLAGSGAFGVNVWATYNLATGAVGNVGSACTATMEPYGNGWYRCTLTGTATATTSSACFIALNQNLPTGDRNSAVATWVGTNRGIYIYEKQDEVGGEATSIITTTSSTATRSADSFTAGSANVVAFSTYYNASTVTAYASYTTNTRNISNRKPLELNGGTSANRIVCTQVQSAISATFIAASSTIYNQDATSVASSPITIKQAISATAGTQKHCAQGTLATPGSNGAHPACDRMVLGAGLSGANALNGILKEIRLYSVVGTNSGLQGLTT